MKPIVILIIGGLSLAATLTVTSWLSAHESENPAVVAPSAVPQVQAQATTPASTNRSSYHHHGRKWGKADPRSVVRSGSESQ